jgi:glyoxylase-like metal-dependent hydrolase (beta-lactamase superfamily II)
MTLHAHEADGVHRIEHAFTNFYLVEDGAALTLVDAGLPTSWAELVAAVVHLGRRLEQIEAVVLTHAHFDHVGIAEKVRTRLGVPVYVHENDVPLSRHPWRHDHERHRVRYLATQLQALPIVVALARNRAWLAPPVREVRRFGDDGGRLPVPGEPRVVFSPGHTLGHCALHLPDRDVLIAGDAVVMLDPYTARRGPCIVAGAATADSERNLRTLDALAETGARTVLTGHGEPWTDGIDAAVARARAAGPA